MHPAARAQTGQYSTQIFSLAVLLSSLFVYNQMGGIDEAALDRLSLVTEMTKHIRVKAGGAAGAVIFKLGRSSAKRLLEGSVLCESTEWGALKPWPAGAAIWSVPMGVDPVNDGGGWAPQLHYQRCLDLVVHCILAADRCIRWHFRQGFGVLEGANRQHGEDFP